MKDLELLLMTRDDSGIYEVIKQIDIFNSLLWVDRYNQIGDFELVRPVLYDFQELVKPNNIFKLAGTRSAMFIEHSTIEMGIENMPRHIIKGRSITSILTRRIIWDQTEVEGTVFDCVSKLLFENLINPDDIHGGEKRKISNFKIIDNRSEQPSLNSKVKMQFTAMTLYDALFKIFELFNIGFKIELNDESEFEFIMYSGVNRSYSQDILPYVVFSPKYENLINSTWISDSLQMKNYVKIYGAGEGEKRKTAEFGYSEELKDLDRIELPVDARDISDKLDSYDVEIDKYTYNDMLMKRGIEKLKEMSLTESFDGQVETSITYHLDEDFWLGDIVQIENEFGVTAPSRIVEIVHSQDDSGIKIYPTFKSDSNIIQDSYKFMEDKIKEYESQIKKNLDAATEAEKRKEREKEEAEKRAQDEEKRKEREKQAAEKAQQEREKLEKMIQERKELNEETAAFILEKYNELLEPFNRWSEYDGDNREFRSSLWDAMANRLGEIFFQEKGKLQQQFNTFYKNDILRKVISDKSLHMIVNDIRLEVNKKSDLTKYNKLKEKHKSLTNSIKSLEKMIGKVSKKNPKDKRLAGWRKEKTKLIHNRKLVKDDIDKLKVIVDKLNEINKSIDDVLKFNQNDDITISYCKSKYSSLRTTISKLEGEKSLINQSTVKKALSKIDKETKELESYEIISVLFNNYYSYSSDDGSKEYPIFVNYLDHMEGRFSRSYARNYYYSEVDNMQKKCTDIGYYAGIKFRELCEKQIKDGEDNKKIIKEIYDQVYSEAKSDMLSYLKSVIEKLKNAAIKDYFHAKPLYYKALNTVFMNQLLKEYDKLNIKGGDIFKIRNIINSKLKNDIFGILYPNIETWWIVAHWSKVEMEALQKFGN